jgi:hypothetical protein
VVLTLSLNGDAADVLALVIMVFTTLTVANVFIRDPLGRGSAEYGRLMWYNLSISRVGSINKDLCDEIHGIESCNDF